MRPVRVRMDIMHFQTQENEPYKVEAEYFANPEVVSKKRKEAAVDVWKQSKNLRLPGFRKGKATLEAVKVYCRSQIEAQTQAKLLHTAEEDILFETKMKTLFPPQVLSSSLHDSRFECRLMFFKKPAVQLQTYKGLKVPKPHATKTVAELTEEILQKLRVENGDILPFAETDVVQMGDKITMDVSCTAEGKEIPELTREGIFYTVGNGFYHEFDDNILGMKTGEEKTFEVVWDSQTKEKATFVVKIPMGVRTIPAPLDDSLAEKCGFDGYDKFRAEVELTAVRQIEEYERSQIKHQIIKQLLATHEVDIPQWLIAFDAQQIAVQNKLKWKEIPEESKKALEEQAKERIKTTLILGAISEAEIELQFSTEELVRIFRGRLLEQKVTMAETEQFIQQAQATGQLVMLLAQLKQEAILGWLVKNCEVIE